MVQLSYMRSVVDRNVVMQRVIVSSSSSCPRTNYLSSAFETAVKLFVLVWICYCFFFNICFLWRLDVECICHVVRVVSLPVGPLQLNQRGVKKRSTVASRFWDQPGISVTILHFKLLQNITEIEFGTTFLSFVGESPMILFCNRKSICLNPPIPVALGPVAQSV